jgi:hypothetical protein
MFFKDYFNSVANILDCKLQAHKNQTNPGDIGDLCEGFIKEFMHDVFSGRLRIFKGGKIIDSTGAESGQIDIVLCSQNSLELFKDKGLYPVETVFGVVNIKKKLTYSNLFSQKKCGCGAIENLLTIPNGNSKLHTGILDKKKTQDNFNRRFPYKIVFGYGGKIQENWEDKLNDIAKNKSILNRLPDIIVVNKQGMIIKRTEGKIQLSSGEILNKYFHYSPIEDSSGFAAPFIHIVHELHKNANWQIHLTPSYEEYFNKDII